MTVHTDRVYTLKRFFHDRQRGADESHRWLPGASPHDFFCYGCEEGRNGYVIEIKRKLGDIKLDELACSGCMELLDSIRLFSIPFVQLYSHGGVITWAVSMSDFVEHKALFTFVRSCSSLMKTSQSDGFISFQFSDNSYDDVVLVKALLKAGLVEAERAKILEIGL